MRPPQVLREGTKKTVFVNFMDLCKTYAHVILLHLFYIYLISKISVALARLYLHWIISFFPLRIHPLKFHSAPLNINLCLF